MVALVNGVILTLSQAWRFSLSSTRLKGGPSRLLSIFLRSEGPRSPRACCITTATGGFSHNGSIPKLPLAKSLRQVRPPLDFDGTRNTQSAGDESHRYYESDIAGANQESKGANERTERVDERFKRNTSGLRGWIVSIATSSPEHSFGDD